MCSLDVLLLVVDVLFAGVYGFSSIFHHFFFHLFFIKILVDVVCGAALRMLLHSYITHTHTLHALSKRSATAHSGTQIQLRSILCVCNACYGNDNCLPAHKHISTHIQQRAHNNAWVLCDNHNWSVSQPRIMNISFIIIDISSYSACTLSYCSADALIAIEQRHQWNLHHHLVMHVQTYNVCCTSLNEWHVSDELARLLHLQDGSKDLENLRWPLN